MLAWSIWNSRNPLIFNISLPMQINVTIMLLLFLITYYTDVNYSCHTNSFTKRRLPNIKWHPPDTNFIKVNFEASIIHNQASIGFVLRDHLGNPQVVAAKIVGHTSVLIAEAIALQEGLHTAYLQNIPNVSIEGDSKVLIDCLLDRKLVLWSINSLVKDIRLLASRFRYCVFGR